MQAAKPEDPLFYSPVGQVLTSYAMRLAVVKQVKSGFSGRTILLPLFYAVLI
jgi:hypothetical protein